MLSRLEVEAMYTNYCIECHEKGIEALSIQKWWELMG